VNSLFLNKKLKRHSVRVTSVNRLGTRNSWISSDRQWVQSIAIYGTCSAKLIASLSFVLSET